jgi:hypothetical protein
MGEGDRLLNLLGRFHPRNQHAVGADIESPFDKSGVQLRNADQNDRVTADASTNVLDDLFPVEMAVLGIDDDPIDAESDPHLGDAGRLEGHPKADDCLI